MDKALRYLFWLLTLIMLSGGVNANAVEPFGLTLGETSLSEFQNKYEAKHGGNNTWTKGPVYDVVPHQNLGIEGLSKAAVIFDTNERLVAIILTMESSKFDEINRLASSRFK